MENFKAKTINNVSEMQAELVSQLDRLTKEDGIDYNISACTSNGVSFYITLFTDIDSCYRVSMRLSDHACGRRGTDYVGSYEEALRLLSINDAIEVEAVKIYETKFVDISKVREDDLGVDFHKTWTTKRGKLINEYRVQRWTGRVRHVVIRKNGAGLQLPEGLDNSFLF